jgi:hypothetical protein
MDFSCTSTVAKWRRAWRQAGIEVDDALGIKHVMEHFGVLEARPPTDFVREVLGDYLA